MIGTSPLLEREHPLGQLGLALARVESGSGCLALVAGEAGIGKTSLVSQFTAACAGRAHTLWGACDALHTPRPLGALHDIALALGGPLRGALETSRDRDLLYSTFLRVLHDRVQPAIVVIEDVHWADEATLDLVKFLGRRVARLHALVVLTYRDDELSRLHPLRSVLGDLPRDATVRVHLQALSETAVAALVFDSHADVLASALHAITGGNPFFITEVLAGGSAGVPANVRDAVLARAARLSPAAREVLDLVSLSPVPVEPWLLEGGLPGCAPALEQCICGGMLRSVGDRHAFRHELARLALQQTLSPLRRLELERLILATLRSRPIAPAMLARLAHHAEGAGDADAVLEYARAAGDQAARLGAHREAAAHYARALRCADRLTDREHAELYECYARECATTADMANAIRGYHEAAALWQRLGEPARQGENLCLSMRCHIGAGMDAEAAVVTRSAIELLEPLGPSRQLALAYRTRAALHMYQRENADAIEWGQRALAMAREFGAADVESYALTAIGAAMIFAGDEQRGIEHLEQAGERARQAGLEEARLNALGNLASALGEVFRLELAERHLAACIDEASEHEHDHQRLYALAWRACVQLRRGLWDDAARTAAEVVRNQRAAPIARMMALTAIGRLRARRGDPGADQALDEADRLAQRTGTVQRIAPVAAARAEAAWLAGAPERALLEAKSAYPLACDRAHPWFVGELAYWQWKVGALDAVPAVAAEPFRMQMLGRSAQAALLWQQRGCPYERAAALAEADDEASLRQALEQFEQLGARPAADLVRQRLRAQGVRSVPRGPRASTRANPFGLTAREVQIVELLAMQLTNSQIAARLHRSEKTVDHHVSAVLAKLGVHSREAAVAAARAAAVLPPQGRNR
ncbi:MAG TPA: AAA family ATPase [Burkholderiaceae bacterium]|nr:AAA family ATPase [Burkholderiaceae bacterium]